jgi:hypothetical protein
MLHHQPSTLSGGLDGILKSRAGKQEPPLAWLLPEAPPEAAGGDEEAGDGAAELLLGLQDLRESLFSRFEIALWWLEPAPRWELAATTSTARMRASRLARLKKDFIVVVKRVNECDCTSESEESEEQLL